MGVKWFEFQIIMTPKVKKAAQEIAPGASQHIYSISWVENAASELDSDKKTDAEEGPQEVFYSTFFTLTSIWMSLKLGFVDWFYVFTERKYQVKEGPFGSCDDKKRWSL